MLVLGRNLDEPIIINDNIFIKIKRGNNGGFKIAIDAPKEVKITRGELHPDIREITERLDRALK